MSDYVKRVPAADSFLWQQKAPLLPHLDMELTERCNNDCIHCCINLPASDAEALRRELSTEEVKRILQEAAELGCLQVRYTGGEPLLRADFEELYLFARRLGMTVLLFTNARLITPHLAELFTRIPPRTEIEVSVYGMHAESYEGVTRSPGSFAQFRRGVDLLLERQVPFLVKGAVLPSNKDEMEEFEAWAGTIPWMDKKPNYAMYFDLRSRRDDVEKDRRIRSLRLTPEEGVKIEAPDPQRWSKEMAEFCQKFVHPTGDQLFSCGAGKGGCVDAYGHYQACLGLRAPELSYDLRKVTLRDAAEGLFSRLEGMKASNREYLARCGRCFLRGLCEQCPAKSWVETGTLDTPITYLCDVAHAQARRLGLISLDETGWEMVKYGSRI